jgi:hypothetical protein
MTDEGAKECWNDKPRERGNELFDGNEGDHKDRCGEMSRISRECRDTSQ